MLKFIGIMVYMWQMARLFIVFVALMATLSSFAEEMLDSSVQEQLDQLNKKVERLQKQLQRQEETLAFSQKYLWKERFRFNGFASFGLSKVNGSSENEKYYHSQHKDLSVLPNTWLGLRLDTQLYNSGELVAQFVLKADHEDKLEIRSEWLFLKQELGAGFSAHLGRIRFPVHIDSEVIYVGNVYPTVTPSAEIYSVLSMNHLDGLALNHSQPLGDSFWVMDSKLIVWGQGKDPRTGLSFRLKEVQGAVVSFSDDVLTARFGVFTAKKTLEINYHALEKMPNGLRFRVSDRLDYLTAAIRFDDQRFYGMLEGIAINSHKNRVDEIRNWNAIAGVYWGPSLLYVGYAKQQTTNVRELAKELNQFGAEVDVAESYCPSLSPIKNGVCTLPAGAEFAKRYNRQQKNLQLGVKYNVTPRVVLKGQAQMLHGFKGTRGVFEYYDDTFTKERKHIYIYDLAVQAFF